MAGANFETIPVDTLSTGFYSDIKKSDAKIVLLRVPSTIKASDLNGIKLELSKNASLGPMKATFSKARDSFEISKSADGALAPVAIAIPQNDSLILSKPFAEVWNVSMQVDVPEASNELVELEDDYGGRSWKKIPQAENLRVPLSVNNVELFPASPKKASKKRKHQPE